MKNSIPNQLFNQPVFAGKTKNSMTRKLLLVFVLMLMYMGAQAQAGQISLPAGETSIMHVDQFLNSLRNVQGRGVSGAAAVESLITDLKPTLYVESGGVNAYGDEPATVVRAAAGSLQSILSLTPAQVQKVEMVIIRMPAGTSSVNLGVFAGFPSLKYIYLQSEVPVSSGVIANMVTNQNPNQQVFYSIHEIN
jgi:Mrp family chromosome partitioning ATPase